MTKAFTSEIFSSTYRDDFKDSDNFHRVLFNSGRALQARELTQLQTITQTEMSRLGGHFFKEGAAVSSGSPTVNNKYEFIKLDTSTNALSATDATNIVGTNLTSDGGIIINVVPTEQIKEQAKKNKPKQVRSKSEDVVVAEVLDELP